MNEAPLKILHIIDSLDMGGTEWNAVRTIAGLSDRGIPQYLASFRAGNLVDIVDSARVERVAIEVPSLYSIQLLREARRLARFVQDNRIDIVHTHDRYSNIFGAVMQLLQCNAKLIVSRRWDARYDSLAKRVVGMLTSRLADRILANSETVARLAAANELLPMKKFVVIPNFVEDNLLDADPVVLRNQTRAELGIAPETPVIVCVANLRPVKNHNLLLDVARLLLSVIPDLVTVLVGEGELRGDIERTLAAHDMRDKVILLGYRPNAWKYHAVADLSVLFSQSEGFPNTLLEALALGVPVVATAVGGIPELVDQSGGGILIKSFDPESFMDPIVQLLRSRALRESLGQRGRRYVGDTHSKDMVLTRLVKLYRSLNSKDEPIGISAFH